MALPPAVQEFDVREFLLDNHAEFTEIKRGLLYLVTVTPELAEAFLKRQAKVPISRHTRRKVSPKTVKQYARQIIEGQWALTHQGLALTPDGTALDGNHRFNAVIRAQMSMTTYLWVNQDPANFAFIDNGRRRVAKQFIEGPHGGITQTAMNIVGQLMGETDGVTTGAGFISRDQSIDCTISLADDWLDVVDEFAPLAAKASKATGISAGWILGHACLVSQSPYSEFLGDWLDGLITGAGLPKGDPRLYIIKRWRDKKETEHLNSDKNVGGWSLYVKAWEAYIHGEKVTTLHRNKGSDVPSLSGVRFVTRQDVVV